MSWRHLIARIGAVIFAFGVLVLLFVAYQLWGTGITTRLHQDALRSQFEHELAILHARHNPAADGPASTTTTQPLRGVATPVAGVAPADGQPIGTIDIPAIGANFVVVQGTGPNDLELGPGHYDGTPLPGQPGNAAIAGHRTTYLHPFYNLNELVPGNPIYITTTQGRFEYDVSRVIVVDPTDLAVLAPTAVPTLTLTTCNPRFSASQRLVVQATLANPQAAASPPMRPPVRDAISPRPAGAGGLAGGDGSVWPALGWAAAVGALAASVWMLLRIQRRWFGRLGIGVLGTLALLVLLFFFFQAVTPLLPASF